MLFFAWIVMSKGIADFVDHADPDWAEADWGLEELTHETLSGIAWTENVGEEDVAGCLSEDDKELDGESDSKNLIKEDYWGVASFLILI